MNRILSYGWRLALSSSFVCLQSGCSAPAGPMPEFVTDLLGVPPSGVYRAVGRGDFLVSTTGGAPLSIRGAAGFCVRFWAEREPSDPAKTRLMGQRCANRTFGDLDWRAVWSNADRRTIVVTPPGAAPIALRYAGASGSAATLSRK